MPRLNNNKLFSITLSESLDIESVKTLNLKDLPAYAKYIREQKFNEFVTIQNNLVQTTRLPLALLEENLAKMLTALSSHSIAEYIATSINTWINGKIQELSRHQIVPEDITIITFIRRKAFRDLLPNYTADIGLSLNILDEVDLFLTEYERVLFRTLFAIQNELQEQAQRIVHIGKSELFAGKITELSPSMISVYNIKTGENLFINKAVESFLGYPAELVIEKGTAFFLDLIHPADLLRIQRENEQALAKLAASSEPDASLEPWEFSYRLRHKNGQYRWVQTFAAVFERDKNNEIEKLINISNDITELVLNASIIREQSEEIEQQKDRHFKMIEEVQDYAILLLSRDAIVENWNRGAEKIKGYSADEIIGKHLRTFYTQADQDAKLPERLIEEAAANGRSTHEGWRVRKNGEKFWAYVVITALHDKSGSVIGFSKVTRDLTSKKFAEDMLLSYTNQLEEKNRQLAAKNKELESFTYIASHDLQEPLRKIKLWADRLLDIEKLPDNAKSATGKITASTGKMQALIAGVLNYVQADDRQKEFVMVDLNGLVKEVLDDYSETLEQKKAVIDMGMLPTLPVIELQIKQLFANLISNAVKYSKPGRPLKISITSEEQPPKTAGSTPFFQIVVSDNGIGFPQEQAENIFEIFRRLGGSDAAGTGIGLAICRKVMQNHDGTIRAESKEGAGTSFFISFNNNSSSSRFSAP